MKKTLFFGLMAAVLGFTACSSDDDSIAETTAQKGMILHATVEQPDETRATFTDNEGTWHFDFEEGDEIKVTNHESKNRSYYTFTNDGEKFVSTDAKLSYDPVHWSAYFPSNIVSLVGQTGAWEDVADKYVLYGSTFDAVTGKDGLNIILVPQVAILKIINKKGNIDINVKTGSNKWAAGYEQGLTISANPSSEYSLIVNDSKATLLSTTEKGTYYIAVPAGIQLAIKDGDESLKSTNGLRAGQYYEIVVWPEGTIKGHAYVVLAGYKWATENVGKCEVPSIAGPGSSGNSWGLYLYTQDNASTAAESWGGSWKLPSEAQWQALIDNCDWEWTDNYNEMCGSLVTGKKENGEDGNSIFLPAGGVCYVSNSYVYHLHQGEYGQYWSKDVGSYLYFDYRDRYMGYTYPTYGMSVRPVSE